jgi:phosphoribosyl 1,2-cyclic phosphodiesterase
MKLTFAGTRGNIKIRTPFHSMHTSLHISYRGKTVIIDCGEDWLNSIHGLNPDAIVLTHGHPDHAWGLKNGAPCPVLATEATWEQIHHFPIEERRVIDPRAPVKLFGLIFEAFPLIHSIRCPAVGYRVSAGKSNIFYAPDVVAIEERADALAGVKLYIGDGATTVLSMVRRTGDALVGHTPIRTQIGWCRKEGVSHAIFTHCGTEIVSGDDHAVKLQVLKLGEDKNIVAEIAHDGMELTV